ncbi:glycosyltransferase family 2 protein [candidate division WWE3 bacterium]|uniref:Glycosyltransferase family 2 protein n=1 Tax=candidate division WWE3 bacterium TaxID=2053526 RepID=A0A955LXK2_UNCKA|nr:glycosyltransferase family 2 protein [candidate division WWE3 bacterium]
MKQKSKKTPLVSVLMPAFNAERYISESIESILGQTFKDYELIILNDASTDTTGEVAKKYAKKYPNVHYYENTENQNIAESRNILVSKARGKYIAWQDADDISVPNRLKLQVAYLDSHPKVGIVGGFLEFFDENGKKSIRKYAEDDDSLRKTIFRYSPVAQPTAMIRAKALRQAGSYGKDLSPAEDIDMSFRIGQAWNFANLSKVTLRYRFHASSNSLKYLKWDELVTIRTRINYALSGRYQLSFFDVLYNVIQFSTLLFFPATLRVNLFNRIRNSSGL